MNLTVSGGKSETPLEDDVDRSVARLSRRFWWFSVATMALRYLAVSVTSFVVLFAAGLVPAMLVLVGGVLVVGAPVLEIHTRSTW